MNSNILGPLVKVFFSEGFLALFDDMRVLILRF